jgi:chaperonin GroES
MSKLRPLHDRVIVKRLGAGRILEDGKVRPMSVKEGDTVLFGKYAGQEIKIDGEELVFLKEDDIVAVIEG